MQHVIRAGVFDKVFVMASRAISRFHKTSLTIFCLLSSCPFMQGRQAALALYDAIYHACHDKLLKEQSDRPQRLGYRHF